MSEMMRPSQGLKLLAELEAAGAITETSLMLPPDTPYENCEALAFMFGQLHRTSAWIIGDLMLHMEKVYGETYAQAAEATGLAPQTLQNYASVCGRVPRSRRRTGLPFSVHAEIASLEPEEQKTWLKKAAENKWTRSTLRENLMPLRREREARDGKPSQIEVLPPEVRSKLCRCLDCGKYHRNDINVTDED